MSENTGLRWGVKAAQVVKISVGQSKKTSEPYCRVTLAYWGGNVAPWANPERAAELRKLVGQSVDAGGDLSVSEDRWGVKVEMSLDSIKAAAK